MSGPFQLGEFGGNGQLFRIVNTEMKQYPCGAFAQTAIDAAIKLRSKISSVDEITAINIETCSFGKKAMGSDAEKWHPKTRESADHSLPYAIAVALMYGPPEARHFADEYLNNPDLLDLMQKTKVEETEECNNLYPDASASRVGIITQSGEELLELVHQNALTNGKIEKKFYSLTRDLLAPVQSKELLSLLWNLEQVADVANIMELLKV